MENFFFKISTVAILIVGLILLGWGIFHRSSDPCTFGRYSVPYLLFLIGITAVVAVLFWVLWNPTAILVRCISNAYVFFLSTLLIVGITEISLRVFNPWGVEFFHIMPYHMQGMIDHPELDYVHPTSISYYLGKNLVQLNEHGLRDEKIPYEKPLNERRILVLGDSVTFGWGVGQGETFSDIIEPLLYEETGIRWQVINAGVNGYNSEQEATFLRIEGMRYTPDVVVLVYVTNDVEPVLEPNNTTWRRYRKWPSSLPELLGRLPQLSYLCQITKLVKRMSETKPVNTDSQPKSLTEHQGWKNSLKALMDISSQCRTAGIPFLLAKESGNDSAFFTQVEQAGIKAITLKKAWEEVPLEQRRVSRIDPHPSVAGHAKIAEYLISDLKTRGWLQ